MLSKQKNVFHRHRKSFLIEAEQQLVVDDDTDVNDVDDESDDNDVNDVNDDNEVDDKANMDGNFETRGVFNNNGLRRKQIFALGFSSSETRN